jgi:hypothetical protein
MNRIVRGTLATIGLVGSLAFMASFALVCGTRAVYRGIRDAWLGWYAEIGNVYRLKKAQKAWEEKHGPRDVR